jgi:hypothetical protein
MENLKLEKQAQDIERYKVIIDYFKDKKNTDRIYENKEYLVEILEECKDKQIKNELEELLVLGLRFHLKSIEKRKREKTMEKERMGRAICDYLIEKETGDYVFHGGIF